MRNNFVALILTHGRPDNVKTLTTLKKRGYTGDWLLVVDNEDKTLDEYRRRYADKVIVFDKLKIAQSIDEGDNFNDRRAIIYARSASFEIAKQNGYRYFIQLDDDYHTAEWRFGNDGTYRTGESVKSLDRIFDSMVEYLAGTPFASVAIAQGGDFIGGRNGKFGKRIFGARKAMNTFICDVERPFQFFGRINEDVNTYTASQRRGVLFMTYNVVSISQAQTQKNKGGMSELYLDSGTYVKSFYSVIYAPPCVTISDMGDKHRRIHHRVNWDAAAPKIIAERWKRQHA